MMDNWGAESFFLYVAALMAMIAAFGFWRMTRRRRRARGGGAFVPVSPQATPTGLELAQDAGRTT
jgi:hypothetical protein